MPLNNSGPISIGGSTVGQSINLELGRSATAQSNLNETNLRTLAGVPSGQISLNNFYGKSNASLRATVEFGPGIHNYAIPSVPISYILITAVGGGGGGAAGMHYFSYDYCEDIQIFQQVGAAGGGSSPIATGKFSASANQVLSIRVNNGGGGGNLSGGLGNASGGNGGFTIVSSFDEEDVEQIDPLISIFLFGGAGAGWFAGTDGECIEYEQPFAAGGNCFVGGISGANFISLEGSSCGIGTSLPSFLSTTGTNGANRSTFAGLSGNGGSGGSNATDGGNGTGYGAGGGGGGAGGRGGTGSPGRVKIEVWG
jgi:hypothetical protein